MAGRLDIVFDGPPGHEGPRFIEVEDEDGRSVRIGQWVQRDDGLWALRLTVEDLDRLDATLDGRA